MVTVVILDNHEPNVVQLTFENLYKELKDIYGSELLIRDKWFDLENVKNRYICFVEPDCLVSEGYFKTQMEDFQKKGFSRLTGIMSATTAINYWDNKIYGYRTDTQIRGILPNRKQKSSLSFSVQVAYVPGAIIRVNMLKKILKDAHFAKHFGVEDDLVYLSSKLSLAFWDRGHRVYVNPNATYLTTEQYVNDVGHFDTPMASDTMNLFSRESI